MMIEEENHIVEVNNFSIFVNHANITESLQKQYIRV